MQANILGPYPVTTGQREAFVFYGTGPASYSQTTGDAILLPNGIYLDAVNGAMSVSKTYYTRVYPSAVGTTRASWVIKWYVVATAAEVANAVDLSAESIQFEAFGGTF